MVPALWRRTLRRRCGRKRLVRVENCLVTTRVRTQALWVGGQQTHSLTSLLSPLPARFVVQKAKQQAYLDDLNSQIAAKNARKQREKEERLARERREEAEAVPHRTIACTTANTQLTSLPPTNHRPTTTLGANQVLVRPCVTLLVTLLLILGAFRLGSELAAAVAADQTHRHQQTGTPVYKAALPLGVWVEAVPHLPLPHVEAWTATPHSIQPMAEATPPLCRPPMSHKHVPALITHASSLASSALNDKR